MMANRRYVWDNKPARTAARTIPGPASLPVPLTERLPFALTRALTDCLDRLRLSPWETVEEIRLRADSPVSLTVGGRNLVTGLYLSAYDVQELLIRLCRGSLYAYEREIAQGYLTLPGGIRVGVAGRAAVEDGHVLGLRSVSGLCIRLPHVHPGVGERICRLVREEAARGDAMGVLIYGPPGVGKTTLLRAAAVGLSSPPEPFRTVIVDTRCELAAALPDGGVRPDVLSGYPRPLGIEIATRTMNAQIIVCDEIGGVEEAEALLAAHRGGVPLICSAHAGSLRELLMRTGIRLLHDARLFASYVGLRRDGCGGFTYEITDREAAARCLPADIAEAARPAVMRGGTRALTRGEELPC